MDRDLNSRTPQKVGSAAKALWARLQASSRSKRDLLRKRRRSVMSAPVTFVKKSPQAIWSLRRRGAGSGGRTRTVSPPLDFESSTSANSIIPAGDGKDPHFSLVKKSTEGCLGSFFYYKKALRAWHKMELPAGIEPATCSLRVNRSTDWATVAS